MDKCLSLVFSRKKNVSHPYMYIHYFKTNGECKEYARKAIEEELGYDDYNVLIEKFNENVPHLHPNLILYEIRVTK